MKIRVNKERRYTEWQCWIMVQWLKRMERLFKKIFFMDMKEAVGFILNEVDYEYEETTWDDDKFDFVKTGKIIKTKLKINDEYFSYIGDKKFLVCIYKGMIKVISNGEVIKIINDMGYDNSKLIEEHEINGVKFHIKRTYPGCNRYRLQFKYKGDKYDCLYGYGVDVNKNSWYYSCKRERNKIMRWFKDGGR